jgi:regulator of replication initiation timing
MVNFFDWLNQWTVIKKNYLKELYDNSIDLIDENSSLRFENESLKNKPVLVDDAFYWNNKWKQSIVKYSAPKKKKVIDYVKQTNIPLVDGIASVLLGKYNLLDSSEDLVPLSVMKWMDKQFQKKEFKYKLDKSEKWNAPEETFDKKIGDCDDWGVLEYYLIRAVFIKRGEWNHVKHRLKCVAGNVNHYGAIPSSAGGHFYLIWLHSDGNWYTVESTFHRSTAIMNFGKKAQKLNSAYGTIWFTFNENHSWSQKSLTISQLDFKKKK